MFYCEEFISVKASAFNPILAHCSLIYCVAKLWALLVKGARPLAHSMTWALWPKLTLFHSPLLTLQQSSLSSKGWDWPSGTALQYSPYLWQVGSRVLLLLHTVITVLLRCVLWCLWLPKPFGLQLEPIVAKPVVFSAWPSFRGHWLTVVPLSDECTQGLDATERRTISFSWSLLSLFSGLSPILQPMLSWPLPS